MNYIILGNIYTISKMATTRVGMNQDKMLAIVTQTVMKKVRYYYAKNLLHLSKKITTALLLVKSCLLRNLCHSTNVSLFKWILELFSHPPQCLRGLPDFMLDYAICYEHRVYKLKIKNYGLLTCEIITILEQLRTVTLSL